MREKNGRPGRIGRRITVGLLVCMIVAYGFLVAPAIRKTNSVFDIFLYSVFLFEDDGVYAEGYTDRAFREIEVGDPMSKVFQKLGLPLEISYRESDGVPRRWDQRDGGSSEQERRIKEKMAKQESGAVVPSGSGVVEAWFYSRGVPDGDFWFRCLSFDGNGIVVVKDGSLFVD